MFSHGPNDSDSTPTVLDFCNNYFVYMNVDIGNKEIRSGCLNTDVDRIATDVDFMLRLRSR